MMKMIPLEPKIINKNILIAHINTKIGKLNYHLENRIPKNIIL